METGANREVERKWRSWPMSQISDLRSAKPRGWERWNSSGRPRWKRLGSTRRPSRRPPCNSFTRFKVFPAGGLQEKGQAECCPGGNDLSILRCEIGTAADGLRILFSGGCATAGPFVVAVGSFRSAAGRHDCAWIRVDAREHCGRIGAAVYHDAAFGQRSRPSSNRIAGRFRTVAVVPGRIVWRLLCWPGY